jgi:hypothetical protein
VKSYHIGETAGGRIDLDEWSRRADGDRASTSARIIDGQTWFNASAGTEIASSISCDPVGATEEKTDITWAYQSLVDLNGKNMELTARASGSEGPGKSARLRLKPLMNGNYTIGGSAEILFGHPNATIFVDWLPVV